MQNIAFLITTCNRQESCQQLVDSLQGQGDIYVLNDGCEYDIEGVTKQIKRSYRFGKEGYWATVNQLFDMRENHQYYFMLPDDFLPAGNMVERAIALWKDINDPKCACINLYADRIGKKCWTAFSPIDKGSLWLTQWVDMCFVAKDIFFYKLGRIPRIKLNWKRKKTISSGVGAHISRTLYNQGCNLYMVKESLVTPQEVHHQSQMHHA